MSTVEEKWKEAVRKELDMLPGKISFYYKNLVTEDSVEYQAETPMLAASVIKLFVMTEAFARMEAGSLDPDQLITVKKEVCVPSCGALNYMHENVQVTVMDLITLMIILSDNTATNILIDLLGIASVNERIHTLGFEKTILNRKMFDAEKAAQGLENYISAKEVGILLEKMHRGTLISKEASAKMLAILKNQRLNHKIPFYLHSLQDAPAIAHKTGEDGGITHDCGIVFAKTPFVLCFCGNETEVPEFERKISEISLRIYQENVVK